MNKLYAVTFKDSENTYWTEFFVTDSFDNAEDDCRSTNPPNVEIVSTVRVPFYMIERAYLLGKRGQ